MRRQINFTFFSLRALGIIGLTVSLGCGSTTATSTVKTFSAAMGAAIKAGRARVSATTSAATGGVLTSAATASSFADQDLVSIDGSGNVAKVFNVSFPIYGMRTTTNYVIVAGAFVSPTSSTGAATVIDSSGSALKCYLYAISKKAIGQSTDAICLSAVPVGDYSPVLAATNVHYSHLGFSTRGTKIYFTDYSGGSLYSWTEGAKAPVKIFSQTIQSGCPGFDDVFLDPSSTNICVLQSALSSCPNGYIYCGTDSALNATITGTVGVPVLAETNQLGKWVASTTQKIDITSLAVAARTENGSNGGMPSGASNTAADAISGNVYIGYAWSLAFMDASANTCLISTTNGLANTGCVTAAQTISAYFQSLFGLGNYAWTYGTSSAYDLTSGTQLRRINLTTDVIDGTNYMASAGMTSINGLAFTSDGRIQVTGLNGSGASVIAYIDSTGAISASSTSVTTLDQLVSL